MSLKMFEFNAFFKKIDSKTETKTVTWIVQGFYDYFCNGKNLCRTGQEQQNLRVSTYISLSVVHGGW